MESLFWGVLGGAAFISLLIHAYTLYRLERYPDVTTLKKDLDTLRLEITDLVDRVDMWQRRDRTRSLRAAKAEEQVELPITAMDRKKALRMKVYGGNLQRKE